MSDESLRNEGCNVLNDGHCAMHGVEVERRKSVIKDILVLRKDVDATDLHVRILLAFRNKFLGMATIAFIIITGCYSYTYMVDSQARAKYSEYASDLKNVRKELGEIKQQQARTDERYTMLNNQLTQINNRLDRLLTLIATSGSGHTTEPIPKPL